MRLLPRPAVASLSLIFLGGCHSAPPPVVLEGKWRCTTIELPPQAPAKVVDQIKKNVVPNTSATFNKDKSFAFTLVYPLQGQWELKDHTVTLKVTQVMGTPIDKVNQILIANAKGDKAKIKQIQETNPNMTAVISEDGKTMSVKQDSGKGMSVTLAKQ